MVLLSIFFTRIRSTGRDHQQIVLYSFCRSMRLLFHLAVKILLQIFLYEDLSTLALHTSVGCISLQNASRITLSQQPILLSENIPNIWHDKSSTKNTRRSDQIETIKTVVAGNKVPKYDKKDNNGQVAIFKEIFDQVRKDGSVNVLFWTKTSQRLTLYLLSSHR